MLAWFIVIAIYYRLFGFPTQYMRAESGVFMQIAHLPKDQALEEMSRYLLRAYSGHFSPLGFCAEFLQSRLFGPNELPWFIRQCMALAVFSSVTSAAVREVLPTKSLTAALALTAIVAFHPFMAELVSWPFMFFQIACLTCLSAAMLFLSRFAKNPTAKNAWLCSMSGYVSMHFFGVGLAISAATLSTLLLTAFVLGRLRTAAPGLVLGGVITALHAIPMMLDGGGSNGVIQTQASVIRFFVLITEQPLAALRSTIVTPWIISPNLTIPNTHAIWGVALVAGICIGLATSWRKAAAFETLGNTPAMTLVLGVYFLTCILIVARLRAELDATSLTVFLIGGRYLIFPLFFGILALATCRIRSVFAVIAAIAMMISTAVFVRTGAPDVWPSLFSISST